METITLDGRTFLSISQALTANQDDYINGHLRLAGAIDVLTGLDGIERTKEKRADDLLTAILLSHDKQSGMGRKYFVLAGALTEVGKTWSRDEANRNALAFAGITDESEKVAMANVIVGMVAGFFLLGEPSSENSRKSSSPTAKVPHTKSAARSTSATSRG